MNKAFYLELTKKLQKINISLTEEQVLDFLKIKHRWPFSYPGGQPSVEIITNNGDMRRIPFFSVSGYLDYDKWKHFYDLGYTTVVSNILDLTEELRNLSSFIQNELGNEINGNFYFSKPGQKASFDTHAHAYHVIVKQIYGQSDWVCGEKNLILKPQETLWIPKRTPHSVISKTEAKLSLTLNCE
jgi:hypothetical protein|tara:strand:+ start:3053 stop:3607 length:555 start_codon:yes stop_codon:yes gene_type:complete